MLVQQGLHWLSWLSSPLCSVHLVLICKCMLVKLISISNSIAHKQDNSLFNVIPVDTMPRYTSSPSCYVDHVRKEKSRELKTCSMDWLKSMPCSLGVGKL